jgi:hypothetical protein
MNVIILYDVYPMVNYMFLLFICFNDQLVNNGNRAF